MAVHDIEPTILRATGGVHPLDVTFIDDEDLATPWKRESTSTKKLAGPMPKSLSVTLANLDLFREGPIAAGTGQPPDPAGRLPEPRVLQGPGDADVGVGQAARHWQRRELPAAHRPAPRLPGCGDLDLLRANGIACDLRDERFGGEPTGCVFRRHSEDWIRKPQSRECCTHDAGVLCAPTAFGKTVTAAAMIARRGVNTLVLVHRTELLKQWQERLQTFSGCQQRCDRHHRRRQGQTYREDRHRRDAITLAAGRGRILWSRTMDR
jgi:hypothetical protein